MSCSFTMDFIQFPATVADKVSELIERHNLKGVLEIVDGNAIHLTSDDMDYDTAVSITDDFFPDLAALLKGTGEDCQVIHTDCDGDRWTYALVHGQTPSWPGELSEVDHRGVPIGETKSALLKCQVFGISKGRVLILPK